MGGDPDSEAMRLAQSVAQRIAESDSVTRALGIVIDDVGPGHARASMMVTEAMINGVGIAYGGYIFLLADSAFAVVSESGEAIAEFRGHSSSYARPERGHQ